MGAWAGAVRRAKREGVRMSLRAERVAAIPPFFRCASASLHLPTAEKN